MGEKRGVWGWNRRKLWLITDLYEGVAWKRQGKRTKLNAKGGATRNGRDGRFAFWGSRPVQAIIN